MSTISDFPDNWEDVFKLDQPLDFDAFLKSEVFLSRRREYKAEIIISRVSGSVSAIASLFLVFYILRSNDGLSTTYHTLVFGLSLADVLMSTGFLLSETMVPKEHDFQLPNPQGNISSCSAQGFMIVVGSLTASLYNCGICIYFLALIRFKKQEAYIRTKLEPLLHGFSIIVPTVLGILFLQTNSFNSHGPFCFMANFRPAYCIGYEDGYIVEGFTIPCGRGAEKSDLRDVITIISFVFALGITPLVILGTVCIMYRAVRNNEKILERYGVGALRGPKSHRKVEEYAEAHTPVTDIEQNKGIWKIIRRISLQTRIKSSLTTRSLKRTYLRTATGYTWAWALAYLPFIYYFFFDEYSFVAQVVSFTLFPLQGLFNFLVFMSPKVRAMKKSRRVGENLTWSQAFIKAFLSKGEINNVDQELDDIVSKLRAYKPRKNYIRMEPGKYSRSSRELSSSQKVSIGRISNNISSLYSAKDDDDDEAGPKSPARKPLHNIYHEEEKSEEENASQHRGKKFEYVLPPTVERIG